ncbi:AMP-binding enzyme [Nocardioides sp. B-3]|uniref:AMP-binding enzyme n=1 Tax=Nocardioides sp. B-3 TaxID=2895565 RepID=UPI002152C01F|nr:AMP-binding protein [Nocardioides sp. B-3]
MEALATEAAAVENPMVLMACGPLMHGGSQWIMGNALVAGQSIAYYTDPNFDAERVLDLAAKSRTVSLAMLGDAMARPIAEAVLKEPERWDLSGLAAISNGAAPLSLGVREEIRAAFPGKFILDSYGASESGATGSSFDTGEGDGSARFGVTDEVQVFAPDMKPAAVGERGMLRRSGPIPIGYYKDEKKTAATFKEVDGVRWVIPGDFARREEDGTVTVLGRGSVCINTGGEKVHPEEVEAVLLRHDGVFDAVVVGTPHERWGQQVTALVQRRDGSDLTESQLIEHAHTLIANYKAPKQVFFVDAVPRTPVSKVDYPAATKQALELVGD